MCLILVATGMHPEYPLVVAANRDEFHERPTDPAHWWSHSPVLAGRDQLAGGTWFAVDRFGRFAAVTNFRDPDTDQAPRSRGELPLTMLAHQQFAAGRAAVTAAADQYSGFNLLAGDGVRLSHVCNRTGEARELPAGLYGLSNHTLDTPWPKVRRGREALRRYLDAQTDLQAEHLLEQLSDRRGADDDELPDTGVPLEWERMLAPIFIVGERYGTRASTVYLLSREGHALFVERRFDASGSACGETRETFAVAARSSAG